MNKDAFWEHVVAKIFNDETLVYHVDFDGIITGISHAPRPTSLSRGVELRKYYSNERSIYTLAHLKRARSGQNDFSSFPDFFLRSANSAKLSTKGKRNWIMFTTFRCGTPSKGSDVTPFTLKTMPDENCSETGYKTARTSSPSVRSSHKRKFEDMQNCFSSV